MKERPILFSGPMVLAILAGCKTQTRRVQRWWQNPPQSISRCPYGVPGDRLWVREAWKYTGGRWSSCEPDLETRWVKYRADERTADIVGPNGSMTPPRQRERTEAEREEERQQGWSNTYQDYLIDYYHRWRPSIFMPRWASRITLEVEEVRVQRVQEIGAEDILAEGLATTLRQYAAEVLLRDQFAALWDSINTKRGFGWDQNPWVWAITFRLLTPCA